MFKILFARHELFKAVSENLKVIPQPNEKREKQETHGNSNRFILRKMHWTAELPV
jgi:hypothetical protein